MFQTFTIAIKGLAPLLMHNGRLNDNRDPFTRELRRYSKRAKKSDEDADTMQHIEWCGGLYHTGTAQIQDGVVAFDKDCKVVMPADNLWACIVEGATISKMGMAMKAALLIDDDAAVAYSGPADINKLAKDPAFQLRKRAKVGMAGVMRTRPVFRTWACTFTATLDTEQVDQEQFREAIVNSGSRKGLGDWTPRYGRFELVEMKAT